MNPLKKAILLITELGPAQLADNLVYRLQLRSGWFERESHDNEKINPPPRIDFTKVNLFSFNWAIKSQNYDSYLAKADEVVSGHFRPFDSDPEKLDFSIPQPLRHWTKYGDTLDGRDIKTYWEPCRFTWVIPLCVAYQSTRNEKYAAAFWKYFESFRKWNPVNTGPNWASAQEVALRLILWVMAGQVFSNSPESTPQRLTLLSDTIWQHTQRILPTLHYAHSQHNNHLLSEALGLLLGGWLFRDTSQGSRWFKIGNREFSNGILNMVDKDGTFSQHSTNYHRMLLHLAMIYQLVIKSAGLAVPPAAEQRLGMSVKWLTGQMDVQSGRVPNLGHNDGTNLLPIGDEDYSDYRPTIQAACRAFLNSPCLPPGPWDDLSSFFTLTQEKEAFARLDTLTTPAIHRIGSENTWASLRVCQFHSRPAHADQLHTEIWFDGTNIALDAGTYAYNSPAPWENALARTALHNTIAVAGQDQMYRAGKFLWLGRADTRILSQSQSQAVARGRFNISNAYTHTRAIEFLTENNLEVIDVIDLKDNTEIPVTIHWLLPDWHWQLDGSIFELRGLNKSIRLEVSAFGSTNQPVSGVTSLIRAGETIYGNDTIPIRGWVSNTYLQKKPALSLSITFLATRQLQIKSFWHLQKK